MLKKITIAAVLATGAMTAIPTAAVANHDGYNDRNYERSYRDDRRYSDRRYSDSRYYQGRSAYRGDRYYQGRNSYRRCSGTTGTIVGGAGGALLGREIAGRGSRTTGLILGGAVGALLGREVGKSTCRR